jgi:sulfate adenylyltransferase subunit 1 (EFTu-like GTPase family)
MDLVGFSREVWQKIADEFGAAVASLGFRSITPIPICARDGDNLSARSERMPWFTGPALLDYLETVAIDPPAAAGGGRLPVQLVIRPDPEFRGYAGTVGSGSLHVGQMMQALPSGQRARIARIVTADGDRAVASAGSAVTVTLEEQIDVSRGDVLAGLEHAPEAVSRVSVRLLWMEKSPLAVGQEFIVQLGPASANARVARIQHAIDIQTYEPWPAAWLGMNEIGLVDLEFDRKLVAAAYDEDRMLGALILVDRLTNRTVGMAVIDTVGEPPDARRRSRLLPSRRHGVWLLGGAVIGTLAAALTRDLVLASTLGLAELALLPVLDRFMEARE